MTVTPEHERASVEVADAGIAPDHLGRVSHPVSAGAQAATELRLRHSLDGADGALVARIADDFNAPQGVYRLVTIHVEVREKRATPSARPPR